MKRYILIILVSLGFLILNSCKEKENTQKNENTSNIKACGIVNPAKNLPWLAELIEKAKTDTTPMGVHYMGYIWLEKYKGQDIFVTDMMLGSGGVAYWFFDCSGNHFISKNFESEACPACEFVGNHHIIMEDEDFQSIILNMKKEVVIYSPF